jgi:hypothetical protein
MRLNDKTGSKRFPLTSGGLNLPADPLNSRKATKILVNNFKLCIRLEDSFFTVFRLEILLLELGLVLNHSPYMFFGSAGSGMDR